MDTSSSAAPPGSPAAQRTNMSAARTAVFVAPTVRAIAEEGASAWPTVRLSLETLAASVKRHVDAHGLTTKVSPELYLVAACVAGDAHAMAILDARYLGKVPAHVAKIVESRGRSSLDDFMQVLRVRLLMGSHGRPPRLGDYSGRGPLGAWIRVVAVRLAIEGYRRETPRPDGEAMAIPCGADTDLDHLHGLHAESFKACLEAAFAALSKEERLVLRLTYAERLTGDRIAKLLGIDRSNVIRRVVRARTALYEATRDAMQRERRITDSEFHSLAKGLAAHVELTLSRVLTSAEA